MEAEKLGHSEDVCTYVKSDIGMLARGNTGPYGLKMPEPDVLLLSYTGCFTFMKWFELLREKYKCETIMLHTPYTGDGKITQNMRDYMVKQLKNEVIPKLEQISGVKFDIERLREYPKESAKAEDNLVWVLQSAKNKPSPVDAYFGGIYYIGPIFGAFRGTKDATEYYQSLRAEVEDRLAQGQGPVTPDGDMAPKSTVSWLKNRPITPASATSGKCSTAKARWSWPQAIRRLEAFTTSASGTIRKTRSSPWPTTALASTRTAPCPSAWGC
jgi:benzoyl-CoA reductase subunit B